MIVSPVHFPIYRFAAHQAGEGVLFNRAFFFQRGSWALAYGLMAIAKKRGVKSVRVWFPDYFCKEPLDVLSLFPISITFYPVQKSFEPDWQQCEAWIKNESPPDAFVLVHYFGFSNQGERAHTFCATRGIELVEDCAHVMRPSERIGSTGTFAVFSPWKFYPIPLLGLLCASSELRPLVSHIPARWGIGSSLSWWFKREVQRALCALGVPWYRTSGARVRLAPEPMAAVNAFALAHLRVLVASTAETIAKRRRQNYSVLLEFFSSRYPTMLLLNDIPSGVVPYAFPFVTKAPAEKLVATLVGRGIPAACWPALPKEVAENPSRYPLAHFYAKHLVLLPIHQSVSEKNVEYMKAVFAASMG